MITKTMCAEGYRNRILYLDLSPNGDGIVCRVGPEYWFYFGGETAEEYNSVEQFKADIDADTIADEIFAVLEDFYQDETFRLEYDFIETVLLENLPKESMVVVVREAVRNYLTFEEETSQHYPFKKKLGEITDSELDRIVRACDYKDDTDIVHEAIESVVGRSCDITKGELRKALSNGKTMNELFRFKPGQDCEIFKCDRVTHDDTIIYIPDTWLNKIPLDTSVASAEDIEDVVGNCYTWNDFVDLCEGDEALAYRLFCYCDWQHPSSALPEVEYESEE